MRNYLFSVRGPHRERDHPQIQQQHHRLAGAVSPGSLMFRQEDPNDERTTHRELHDQVNVGLEGGASTKESIEWK